MSFIDNLGFTVNSFTPLLFKKRVNVSEVIAERFYTSFID